MFSHIDCIQRMQTVFIFRVLVVPMPLIAISSCEGRLTFVTCKVHCVMYTINMLLQATSGGIWTCTLATFEQRLKFLVIIDENVRKWLAEVMLCQQVLSQLINCPKQMATAKTPYPIIFNVMVQIVQLFLPIRQEPIRNFLTRWLGKGRQGRVNRCFSFSYPGRRN